MPRNRSFPLPHPLFDEPTFNEPTTTPDPTGFSVRHPSDKEQYARIQQLLSKDVVWFPESHAPPDGLFSLATAWGPNGPGVVGAVQKASQIVFQLVGDIGASTAAKYPGEIRVSDQVSDECLTAPVGSRPAFLYILGDVVYDFGQAQYYFDEFYDPYRNYPGPIFAIPGNHDSFILPGTPERDAPLETFQRNFCSKDTVVTAEAGSLHRTAMTQPGVYFSLDAPFVRIIGLFSNSLEDPGVISSEQGKWSTVPDYQLAFLSAQLALAKKDGYAGALLLAVHHPPFSYAPPPTGSGTGGIHAGSPAMLAEIDTICKQQGVYPHAILSGHAHNYQRYTRTFQFSGSPYQVPYVVCGDGGHGIDPLVRSRPGSPKDPPQNGQNVSYLDPHPVVGTTTLTLDRSDDQDYGYLRVTVDAATLRIEFHQVGQAATVLQPADVVSVDLRSHTVLSGATPATKSPPPPARPSGRGRK